MRCFLFVGLMALVVMASPALANEEPSLEENIRGYRVLSNTPPAPAINVMTQDGRQASLDDYKGKTVLLNLWATWCPPCIKEMPALNELASEFKDRDFVVVAVATGRQGRETPDGFLKKRNLDDIRSYLDPPQYFLRLLGLETLPVSFLIDPQGNMIGGVVGMTEWNTDEAKSAIAALLPEKQ